MCKRGEINPVYGMTNAKFFGRLSSMIRKEWMYSKPYRDALKRAKVPYSSPENRRKFQIKCEQCGEQYFLGERVVTGQTKAGKDKTSLAYQVDHKKDVGSMKSFDNLGGVIKRLFCPPEGLQVLCKFCHNKKTHEKERA